MSISWAEVKNRLRVGVGCAVITTSLTATRVVGQTAQGMDPFRAWGTDGPESPPVPPGWTEVPPATPITTVLVPTPEEIGRGFVVIAPHPFGPAEPYPVPTPAERAASFEVLAARGEYQPVALGLYALEDLGQTEVKVSDLRSGTGATIPSTDLEVRVARNVRVVVDATHKRYRSEPFILERRSQFPMRQATSTLVWLTLKMPETATASVYRGLVTVRAAARVPAELELIVRVLPFVLPPAPIEMVAYYPRPAEADGMLQQELAELREHGVLPIPAMEARVKSRDRRFGADDAAETTVYCRRLDAQQRELAHRAARFTRIPD